MLAQLSERKQPKLKASSSPPTTKIATLQTVFGPAEQQDDERAIRRAKALATRTRSVEWIEGQTLRWESTANPGRFQAGDLPNIE